jgi:hypothetical protein
MTMKMTPDVPIINDVQWMRRDVRKDIFPPETFRQFFAALGKRLESERQKRNHIMKARNEVRPG